jgi:resuscitation-promoting factor RpfA
VRIDIDAKALTVMSGALGIVAALTLSPPAFADSAVAPPAPAPAPAPDVQAAGTDGVTPPNGMPHLSSPDNLPPGTTTTPPDDNQPRGLGYLRDLWHDVQTQNVSGRDALLLLTQRPLDPDAVPPPGLPAGPTPPQVPGVPSQPGVPQAGASQPGVPAPSP